MPQLVDPRSRDITFNDENQPGGHFRIPDTFIDPGCL